MLWIIVIAVAVGYFIKEVVDGIKDRLEQQRYLDELARNWQRNAWQPGDPLNFD